MSNSETYLGQRNSWSSWLRLYRPRVVAAEVRRQKQKAREYFARVREMARKGEIG